MTRNTGQRRHHFKNTTPNDPAVTPFAEWPEANQIFFKEFREWLQSCGYRSSTLHQYSVAMRSAIGYLNKPHETIHPITDLERVRIHFSQRDLSPHTQRGYGNALCKLAEFLGEELGKPVVVQQVNWEYRRDFVERRTTASLSFLPINLAWLAVQLIFSRFSLHASSIRRPASALFQLDSSTLHGVLHYGILPMGIKLRRWS